MLLSPKVTTLAPTYSQHFKIVNPTVCDISLWNALICILKLTSCKQISEFPSPQIAPLPVFSTLVHAPTSMWLARTEIYKLSLISFNLTPIFYSIIWRCRLFLSKVHLFAHLWQYAPSDTMISCLDCNCFLEHSSPSHPFKWMSHPTKLSLETFKWLPLTPRIEYKSFMPLLPLKSHHMFSLPYLLCSSHLTFILFC